MTKSLDFGREYRAREAWSELLSAFQDTVKLVGPKEAAWALDVSATDLHNALAERSRRYVKAEWTPWLVMADESHQALRVYAGLSGFDLVPKAPLTPEQELAEYKRRVRSFSPQLANDIEKEIGA